VRVLFTGRGTSGSWQCRGVQLGGELGNVQPKVTSFDGADLVVMVKRPAPGQIEALQRSGKPWVWDVVDFYPQPLCTKWTRQESIEWVRSQIERAKPNGVIWPNQRMADDCGGTLPDCVVYHHHRPLPHPRRTSNAVRVVGYEGSPRYLGRWIKTVQKACHARGLTFTTKGTPWDFDICLAVRDSEFNGYAQRHWKSNVKLANCHGAGTPFIGAREDGYLETAVGGEVWCDDRGEFAECLNTLMAADRSQIARNFVAGAYPLKQAAQDLSRFLQTI
jgi:hypothetical protein